MAQAFYVKEKGYGMGKYSGRITSLLTGKAEAVSLEGNTFDVNQSNLAVYRHWWKLVNIEHFIVFAVTGAATILLLSLLSFVTVFGQPDLTRGISFLFVESAEISARLSGGVGILFLVVVAVMLFATQLTVLDATSRIMAENIAILLHRHFPITHLAKYFYAVLWLQILAGIIILLAGFSEPLSLLTTGAILNAAAMFVSVGLVVWLNLTSLHHHLRPSLFRLILLGFAFLFFGAFLIFTFYSR